MKDIFWNDMSMSKLVNFWVNCPFKNAKIKVAVRCQYQGEKVTFF